MERTSEEILRVEEGSLVSGPPEAGWIRAAWGVTETNRKARFYSLTGTGRKQLDVELANWKRLTAGVGKVLSFA